MGLHPIPIVYGMTIGELAQMMLGENWVKSPQDAHLKDVLHVVPCQNYTRKSRYNLPIAPSPNLPTMQAIYLYASLALFEGTVVSEGRGTDRPFEIFGYPEKLGTKKIGTFVFTPKELPHAKRPKFKDTLCFGEDLQRYAVKEMLDLSFLIKAYKNFKDKKKFFLSSGFFDLLAGNKELRSAIENGQSITQIRENWQKDILLFKEKRKKYLIYPEE